MLVEARGHRLECPEPIMISEEVQKVAEMLQDIARTEEIYGVLMWLENTIWYEGFREGLDVYEEAQQKGLAGGESPHVYKGVLVEGRKAKGRGGYSGGYRRGGQASRGDGRPGAEAGGPADPATAGAVLQGATGSAMGGVHEGGQNDSSREPGHAEEDS